MSAPIQSEAFLLRSLNYSESHRILTFFSPEQGLISAMALGARKSNKRSMGLVDYLKRLQLHLEPPRRGSLLQLKEVSLLESYPWVEKDYDKSLLALEWCAALRSVLREGEQNKEIYFLLVQALRALKALPDQQVDLLFYKKTLTYLGYELKLSACGACGKAGQGLFLFEPAWGGLRCQACAPSEAAFKLAESPPQDLWYLDSLSSDLKVDFSQLKKLLKRTWTYYLERPKSRTS